MNAEAARLARRTDGIVAIGHLGATAGTLDNPTGPLLDLADNVSNVDAVIGDHTDFQVLTTRSNGVLTTENRSKGIRFTRVRLVFGQGNDGVVYMTADFHKPWNIGVTPDAPIQARIDDLNAQLAPVFNTVVGESTVAIPRGDACAAATGRVDGRACESLVGDLVTDALRPAVQLGLRAHELGRSRGPISRARRRTARRTSVRRASTRFRTRRDTSRSRAARRSGCCRSGTWLRR